MEPLELHEFSGTVSYETLDGEESMPFGFELLVSEDADPELLKGAAKILAGTILIHQLDTDPPDYSYN